MLNIVRLVKAIANYYEYLNYYARHPDRTEIGRRVEMTRYGSEISAYTHLDVGRQLWISRDS